MSLQKEVKSVYLKELVPSDIGRGWLAGLRSISITWGNECCITFVQMCLISCSFTNI